MPYHFNVCLVGHFSRCKNVLLEFMSLNILQGGGKKKYDDEESMTENSEDTDSDFEDPDTVAVPQTLRSAGGAGGDKKAAPTVIEDGSDDDIEVISSTNNGTKFGFGGMGKPGDNLLIH